jgi:hypothetical protein
MLCQKKICLRTFGERKRIRERDSYEIFYMGYLSSIVKIKRVRENERGMGEERERKKIKRERKKIKRERNREKIEREKERKRESNKQGQMLSIRT